MTFTATRLTPTRRGRGQIRNRARMLVEKITAAAFGLQLGAQEKTIILVFMQEEALKNFRHSKGWKAGVDGSVVLITLGAGGSIDTTNIQDPIVAFVMGQKGLMFNVTLEGSKFTRLNKS